MISRRLLPILTTLALASLAVACSSDESDGSDTTATGGSTSDPVGGTGGAGTVPADYSWENKTFYMKIPKTRWSAPGQVGAEVGDFVPPFLLSVGACTAAGCSVTIGTAINPDPALVPQPERTQELCNTTMVAAIVTASPTTAISIGPMDFPMYIRHYVENFAVQATVRNMLITNVLPMPGATVPSGIFTAVVDIREIASMFTELGDQATPDGVCNALPSLGAQCEPCPDLANYCISMRGEMLVAEEFAGAFKTITAPEGTDCTVL